jgi:hypothetical protein
MMSARLIEQPLGSLCHSSLGESGFAAGAKLCYDGGVAGTDALIPRRCKMIQPDDSADRLRGTHCARQFCTNTGDSDPFKGQE